MGSAAPVILSISAPRLGVVVIEASDGNRYTSLLIASNSNEKTVTI